MCFTLLLLILLLILLFHFILGENLLNTVLCLSSKLFPMSHLLDITSKFRIFAMFVIIDLKEHFLYIIRYFTVMRVIVFVQLLYPLCRRLGEPHSLSGRHAEEGQCVAPAGNGTPIFRSSSP
jgi:hypothetical protein